MEGIIKLAISGLFPTALAAIFALLDRTNFRKLNYKTKQVIYGVSFGALAIIGTEWGIPFKGAVVNTRDAAVIVGGLIFGCPTAIIAGLIGGIERYFAVYWGAGTFTRIACTVSTIIAGFYTAAMRKYLFDDTHPSWALAFATGLVMEVFHMVMVFLTNMSDTVKAMEVVKTCSLVMVPANALGTMLAVMVVSLMIDNRHIKDNRKTIAEIVQRFLLMIVVAAFALTTMFMISLQTQIAKESSREYLRQAIADIESDVLQASDESLIELAHTVKDLASTYSIKDIATQFDIAEIDIVDQNGIIVESTNESFVGFDFHSGEQSREFLPLLSGRLEYVQKYGPISFDETIYRKYAGVKTDTGFIQIGYDAEQFQNDIRTEISISATNRHIGNTGYVIIADENKLIVSAPKEHMKTSLLGYGLDKNDIYDEIFEAEVDGEKCFCMCSLEEGYYIYSIYPQSEAFSNRNAALYANTFMEILLFAVLFVSIYLLIKFVVVDKINIINDSLNNITCGDLDEVIKVDNNLEFISLSAYINATVATLKEYIKQANERINAELDYAKNIQNSALPHVFPESEHYEVYALMNTAKEVGGDFYDLIRTSRNEVNFMIADVSGKGIPGAMFMMRAKSELHSLTETGIPVSDVFTYGNNSLCEGNEAGMFVTAWQGCLNLETGLVKFANAGHNPPVIMHPDGSAEYLRSKPGFILAGMEDVQYKLQELQMNEGDILFLYTDGVTESNNEAGELFGEERLLECLKRIDRSVDMIYLCCEVIGEVGRFVGNAEQFDDITMLAIKYKGNKQGNE